MSLRVEGIVTSVSVVERFVTGIKMEANQEINLEHFLLLLFFLCANIIKMKGTVSPIAKG